MDNHYCAPEGMLATCCRSRAIPELFNPLIFGALGHYQFTRLVRPTETGACKSFGLIRGYHRGLLC